MLNLADGKTHFIATVKDITGRKRAEEALRESEERYRTVVELSPDPIMVISEGKVAFCNQATVAIAGVNGIEDLLGMNAFDLLQPGFQEAASDRVTQALQKKSSIGMMIGKIARPDGKEAYVEASSAQITFDGQKAVLTMVRDITARKQAEEAYRKLEKRYQQALELSPVWLWASNVEATEIYLASPGAKILTGHDPEEFIKRPKLWFEILHEKDHKVVIEANERARREKVATSYECRIKHKDGNIHWMHDVVIPECNEAGELTGVHGFAIDITERKQAQEERENLIRDLEQKNAEMERFNYTVSHDLKSPLITIKGFTDLLEKELVKGKNQDAALGAFDHIHAAIDKMHLLLDDLLELSRVGRLVNPPEKFALGPLVDEVLEQLSGPIENRKVHLEIDPDLPTVFADRSRIAQVMQNLIENGVKFMGDQKSSEITIGSREEGGEQVIYVRDNGIGIDPEHHNRIFDLFQQLAPSKEGSGVGLTMVKRIIELHGGRIWVEAEGAGKGAAFCFTLPATNIGSEKAEA